MLCPSDLKTVCFILILDEVRFYVRKLMLCLLYAYHCVLFCYRIHKRWAKKLMQYIGIVYSHVSLSAHFGTRDLWSDKRNMQISETP